MNEASKAISESLLGEDFKTVILSDKGYTIYAPVTKVICRIVKEWSSVDFDGKDQTHFSVIPQIPQTRKPILKGICKAIVGDSLFWRFKAWRLERTLDGTSKEINMAVSVIVELMGADFFFNCANSLMSVTSTVAKPK